MSRPTPIQSSCIPPIIEGRDVIGVAQTGSGKTLAFALPMLQCLGQDPYGIFALVLTPTRELAGQIADQFRLIGKRIGLRDCVVVGGKDMVTQGKELAQRPHVVIATPGRLADHLDSCNTFSLKKIKFLVLDEADRMMDGSFDEQLEKIFKALPKKRQTLLFTATINESLETLQKTSQKEPFYYEAPSTQVTVQELDQRFVLTPVEAKDGYLIQLVQNFREKNEKGLIIIFVRTIKECQVFSMMLSKFGYLNVCLHSNKTTRERGESLAKFRSHHARILIATDVASRGLDIPEVHLVINHNVPTVSKNYVHRVGRTARAGKKGQAVTLVTPHDVKLVKAIEELTKVEMKELEGGLKDEDVADILTQVNVTRREMEMKLDQEEFDEKKKINKRKKLLRKGIDPDEEEKRLEKVRLKKQLKFKKKLERLKKKGKNMKQANDN